ncbi:hypothetical protein [Desulfosarcina sp.]|uniref:hypothetical protein n=1 Tax=Desulfosarcina sp. TaxID=2027861 RepID=UPI003970E150
MTMKIQAVVITGVFFLAAWVLRMMNVALPNWLQYTALGMIVSYWLVMMIFFMAKDGFHRSAEDDDPEAKPEDPQILRFALLVVLIVMFGLFLHIRFCSSVPADHLPSSTVPR